MNFIFNFIHRRIGHRPNLVKIVHNISWLFFDKILRLGVGFFVGVWIVRYLGPEQFGLLSFATAFVGLFSAIAPLGLHSIVVRDIVRNPEGAGKTLGTAAILQLVGGLISYLLILSVIAYLRPDETLARNIIAILGSLMLLNASEIIVYWFESQVQSKYIVWVQNSVFLVFATVKVVLILQEATLTAFVWAMLGEAVVIASLLLIVMNKRGHVLRQLEVSAERAKKLLKDSWPLILSSIAIVLYMRIDQIMLGQMVNDETVGIYSAAIRVSEVWYFVPIVVTMSLRPLILKARANHQSTRYLDLIKGLSASLLFLSMLVGIFFSVFSQEIILFLFGPPYLEASSVLTLHIWTGVFVGFGLARGIWIIGENLQRYDLIFIAGGAVINVIGNFILIPSLGMLGAAIATLLAQAFVGLISPVLITKTRRSFFLLLESCNIFKWIELARLLKK